MQKHQYNYSNTQMLLINKYVQMRLQPRFVITHRILNAESISTFQQETGQRGQDDFWGNFHSFHCYSCCTDPHPKLTKGPKNTPQGGYYFVFSVSLSTSSAAPPPPPPPPSPRGSTVDDICSHGTLPTMSFC